MKSIFSTWFSLSVVMVFLSLTYTNCSRPAEVGLNLADKPSDNSALGNPNPGSGDGLQPELPGNPGDLFTRIVNIPVQGGVEPTAQKIKLLLVVDNSKSMRLVRERITQSLNSLIMPLRQFNVEIKIITTSEIMRMPHNQELENQGFSYKSWTYGVGIKPNPEEARILSAQPQETFGIYSYGEYHYLNDKYRVSIKPGDLEINTKLNQLKEMILDVSANTNGSNREQGLCNLLLALHDRGPHQFFEKNDMAGVLLVSDENDQSFWNSYDTSENRVACRNMYIHGSLQDLTLNREVVDDAVNFNIYSARFNVSFDYNNDGIIERRNTGDNGGYPLPYDKYSNLIPDLNEKPSLICPQDFYNNTVLGYGTHLGQASGGTNVSVTNCKVTATWTALYNFATQVNNVCVGSFSKNGKTYESFSEYVRIEMNKVLVPGSCSHSKSRRAPNRQFGAFYLKGSEDPETNRENIKDAKLSQASIKAAIMNQAKRLFGKEKFFMGNLIHKSNDCISDSSIQSIGLDYQNLFANTEFSDRIISESICSSDYTPVLQALSGDIVTSIGRTYSIADFKAYEIINRVYLVSGSLKVQLVPDDQYIVMENKITIDPSVTLKSGDILQVEIISLPE